MKLSARQLEALTVAMILAPGVYARNRMYDLFLAGGVRRARRRASMVRGIVPHLDQAQALTVTALEHGDVVVSYRIPTQKFSRVVEVSPTELAALRLLAARANVVQLRPEPDDRLVVESTLASLLGEPSSRAGQ